MQQARCPPGPQRAPVDAVPVVEVDEHGAGGDQPDLGVDLRRCSSAWRSRSTRFSADVVLGDGDEHQVRPDRPIPSSFKIVQIRTGSNISQPVDAATLVPSLGWKASRSPRGPSNERARARTSGAADGSDRRRHLDCPRSQGTAPPVKSTTERSRACRSVTVPPLARTRSSGAIGNTSCHVPAAAHTSSYASRSGSTKTGSGVAWPNGGTPPIGKPVAARTVSASTRAHVAPPAAAASLASSSWLAPLT